MSESPAKVRLVRCPKCENLLPEVTEYAVYQCGGCGAVLRARNKSTESGRFSENSNEESDGAALNKSSKEIGNSGFSKRSVKSSSIESEIDIKSNGSSGRRVGGEDQSLEMNKISEEMCNLKIAQEFEESKSQIGNNNISSQRSVRTSNWRNGEEGFQNSGTVDAEEGPSNYHREPHHEYAELVHNRTDMVEIDDDRAELLRKLDELKDQIVRSRPLGDKSKEKVPMHHHMPSIGNYVEPPTFSSMHQHHHSALPSSNQVQGFHDPFRSQMVRRAPIQAPVMPFEQNPYHPYFPGKYVSNDVVNNRQFHHPSCSCLICYSKHQHAPPPPPVVPPVLSNDPIFYHHDYNTRLSKLPSASVHNPEPHTRWSSDLRRHPRGILATGGRRCCPVAGGSPFLTCCNCFELLQVPKMSVAVHQRKMRCAACSEVILLSIVNKKLVLSVCIETKRKSEMAEDSNTMHGNAKWGSMEFSSDDYDNSSNIDFQSMDRLTSGGPSLTSYKSAAVRSAHSTSSYTSEDEGIHETREVNSSNGTKLANKPSPPPCGSPLLEHFDYSTKYNRAGKGNRSGRSDMEKVPKLDKVASRQNSMKDAAVATEMEISSNEYSINTGTSQESGNTSKEVDQMRNNRGGDSFFAGIIKKSFREFSRSSDTVDHGRVNVTVNGHPIPDRLVKKAEKLAGPIQPGEYWYDSRAGFWGMMGAPCRGIIPPFIEEFNYPMPENCAAGNTGVFVNGRELHQKDLDLLASRGLPTETDRSYIIEISGRVLDEDTGQELECLGKLAPTVESKKHGFGMRPPRVAAAK